MSIRNRMKLDQLKGGTLKVADGAENAMDIKDTDSTYLKIVSTNSGELIELGDGTAGVKLEGALSGASIVTETAGIGSNDVDSKVPSVAAVKDYVDGQVAGSNLKIGADTGSDSTVAPAQTLEIAGGAGIGSTVQNQTITLDLADTGVANGTYGGASSIPSFQVDAKGRLTSASGTALTATNVGGFDI